jgi:hypothetical protein
MWLASHVSQALFDAACQVPGLEGLHISSSGIESVDSLRDATRLKYFHLGSSPRLASFTPLSELQQLKVLGIENVERIHDLSPLSVLTGLEGLSVEGSMWTTQYVDTLEPIGSLSELASSLS